MNEELELAKVSLKNANDYADIKSNPVVESVLMPIVKAVPVIGDMIDSSMNKVIEEFQKKKEKELIEVILKDKNSITYNNMMLIIATYVAKKKQNDDLVTESVKECTNKVYVAMWNRWIDGTAGAGCR